MNESRSRYLAAERVDFRSGLAERLELLPSRQARALSCRDFDTRMFAMNMERLRALVDINDRSKNGTVCRPVHYAESTAFHIAGAAVSLILIGTLNCS